MAFPPIATLLTRGPAKAPGAIRTTLHSGMMNLVAENGVDIGDPNVMRDHGDLALDEKPTDFDRIADEAAGLFAQSPAVFLGGDHFITWPILEGLARAGHAPPNVIHIDAHPDLYPDFDGNPHSHASPFARLCEAGRIKSLTQIGIRTINDVQRSQIKKYDVRVITPNDMPIDPQSLPTGPTYISLDIDGLDPAFAPGVSHHEPGGLSVREVLKVIAAAPGPIIGADIVEYNPNRDLNDMTAAVAAKMLKELVGRIAQDAVR